MRYQLLIGHLLPLFMGVMIYMLFRTENLIMFEWSNYLFMGATIDFLREFTLSVRLLFPAWFLFSLPDGLWMFSYVSLILHIWNNEIKKQNLFWVISIPIVAILSELGQLLKIVPGTYDAIDLVFYFCGAILPIIFFEKNTFKFSS